MLQPPPPIVKSALPHVFTPNGDTFNEVFKVGPPRGGLSLIIMNREGQELFSDNTNSGWTGDGHESGVYFWYVQKPINSPFKSVVNTSLI